MSQRINKNVKTPNICELKGKTFTNICVQCTENEMYVFKHTVSKNNIKRKK